MYKLVAGTGPFTADFSSKTTPGIAKRVASWHFSNTVAAAVINLRNGSVTGDIVAQIQLATGASASQSYPSPQGLVFPDGLFVQVVTGTIVGSVDFY